MSVAGYDLTDIRRLELNRGDGAMPSVIIKLSHIYFHHAAVAEADDVEA